ncbi:7-carboxy-7-deazaguanine synthase QueE [Anaerobaca lacustris]|uniref:7-carboxy-7-deazaguanine synthase n=1 Tax=Anaerobaca lacustris TaxID=3044600 RepID=A0AAW6TSW9_9BACT|nr:7-carboxy-7-deazaguanine synthase QueE [Sedimentisphaerales bacterium M17dextr]
MRVIEIFHSLQGEGILSGTPSVFVRLAGCPLRCRWCDTKYAWDFSAGDEYGVDDLVEAVSKHPCDHVVITGGEPMVGPDLAAREGLAELTRRLRAGRMHVTIETAGRLFIADLACDLMSISPKMANSVPSEPALAVAHERQRTDPGALAGLIEGYPCQLKFVVEAADDIDEIHRLLDRLPPVPSNRVLLMPQAGTRDELLARAPAVAQLCRETGYRFGHRLHVLLWSDRRGV